MKKSISRGLHIGSLTNQVVEFIKNQILEGELQSGEFLISERKLSELIGVSRVTIRRGLDLLVDDKIIEKKPNQGYVFLGGSFDVLFKKQKAILFIHQQDEKVLSSDEQMFTIWEGARLEAKENDLLTVVKAGVKSISKELAKDLSRISCAVVTDIIDKESIENLIAENVIVVHLDYYIDTYVDNILQDDFGGMIDGVETLLKLNCNDIAFFSTFKSFKKMNLEFNSEVRLSAFKTVLDRHDLPLLKSTVTEVESKGEGIENCVKEVLEGSTDALIFPHNYLFEKAIDTIKNSAKNEIPILVWGVSTVKTDLNVITIEWDAKSMGREAVRRVLLRLAKPKLETVKILISCKICT